MNYLVASDRFFGDAPGGSYRVAWELARLMRDRGHSVSMLCGSVEADPPPGASIVEDITVVRYRFPDTPTWDPLRMRRHVTNARLAATRWLGDTEWDVVHAHVPAGALATFGTISGRARRIYSIHSPHLLEQRINWNDGTVVGRLKVQAGIPIIRRSEQLAYQGAHQLHALSNFTRATIETLFGAEISSRISVIPWWSETSERGISKTEARRRLRWPNDKPILLSLRRMVPRMGLSDMVDAVLPLFDDFNFHVVLAGDGPDRRALQRRAAEAGMGSAIAFPGFLTEEEVNLAYYAADLFVLPTVALECFGLIALEALSHGLPVVATNVGAIPEVIEQILPQCLCFAGDVQALRGTIRAFLENRLNLPEEDALVRYAHSRYEKTNVQQAYQRMIEVDGALTA